MKSKRIKDRKVLNRIKQERCVVCGNKETDPAHIRSRGSGGGDVADNLLALCRHHHSEQHNIGIVTFAIKYPAVELLLEDKGWSIRELFGQMKLTRSRDEN